VASLTLRGVRAPGTGIPGVISLGTRRATGVRDFAAVYRNRPALVIDLDGAGFNRLIVSVDDPAAVAASLAPPAPSEAVAVVASSRAVATGTNRFTRASYP
jgi:hypothetical protein